MFFEKRLANDRPCASPETRTFLKGAARELNIDPFRVYATGFFYGGRTDLTTA